MARTHGKASTYRAGCRCDECRSANNTRMREYQRSRGGNLNRKVSVQRAYYERTKAEFGSQRKRWPDAARRGDEARRARLAGVESEAFDSREIFERDGWLCGICELPVDAALRFPDPGSPSLDHVLPLSRGGSHTRANTQLAHLYCNNAKGNRDVA